MANSFAFLKCFDTSTVRERQSYFPYSGKEGQVVTVDLYEVWFVAVLFVFLLRILYLHLSNVLTAVYCAMTSVSVWQKLCINANDITELICKVKKPEAMDKVK